MDYHRSRHPPATGFRHFLVAQLRVSPFRYIYPMLPLVLLHVFVLSFSSPLRILSLCSYTRSFQIQAYLQAVLITLSFFSFSPSLSLLTEDFYSLYLFLSLFYWIPIQKHIKYFYICVVSCTISAKITKFYTNHKIL